MSRLEIVFSLSWSWSYCVGVVSRLRVQEDTWRLTRQTHHSRLTVIAHQFVGVQRFSHFSHLHSFWSHSSFSACRWPKMDDIILVSATMNLIVSVIKIMRSLLTLSHLETLLRQYVRCFWSSFLGIVSVLVLKIRLLSWSWSLHLVPFLLAARKPLLLCQCRSLCLAFTNKYVNKTCKLWSEVLSIDETHSRHYSVISLTFIFLYSFLVWTLMVLF